jgi:hypothetical protein
MNSHHTLYSGMDSRFDSSADEALIQLFIEKKPWNIRDEFRRNERFEMSPFTNTHILKMHLSLFYLYISNLQLTYLCTSTTPAQ